TFKDKPSMTRLIDNMEKQHLVVRISDKNDRRTNLVHLTKTGKDLEEKARFIANKTLKEALKGITLDELTVSQKVLRKIFTNTKD
ncbi:MAG: MarR family winged helix-turn-helix transcriptional regulator, partial [Phocaeicola sp.]